MQNHSFEERTTDEHYQPVPVQRGAFARRRDVIEVVHAVTESAPDRLQAIAQQQKDLRETEITDVLQLLRKACVHVIAFDAKPGTAGGRGRGSAARTGIPLRWPF